jgi:hypothetical protein
MTVGRQRHGVNVTVSSSRRWVAMDDHQRRRAAVAVARPEGGSTADRRRGDQGIAAAVKAALALWARPP